MLKIVYRVCCGMDVHKSFVVACIASTNEYGVTTYKSKRFSTFTGDLRRCAEWLFENNCKDVCMESTGKYWIPIYNNPGRTPDAGKLLRDKPLFSAGSALSGKGLNPFQSFLTGGKICFQYRIAFCDIVGIGKPVIVFRVGSLPSLNRMS